MLITRLLIVATAMLSLPCAAQQKIELTTQVKGVLPSANGGMTTTEKNKLAAISGTNTGDQTITLTGDVSGSGTAGVATTLATVNSNVGIFGSSTLVPVITVNGKGLVTAVSTVAVSGGGGGGAPGGSTTQIQYNNAGLFAGTPSFTWDNANSILGVNGSVQLNVATTISNPPPSTLKLFAGNVGGRIMPRVVGPTGLDFTLQPHLTRNKIARWNPPGNATTTPGVDGTNALTALGTATARNVAAANRFTRMRRLGYVSAATAAAFAGHFNPSGVTQWTIGTGSGDGGFHFIYRFGSSDAATVAGARQFVGFSSSTATPANVEPSTLTNSIGVCHGAADSNLKICFGGSTAQTPIDLGANFPANTLSADPYELILFASPYSSNVSYRVENLRTGNFAEGTITNTTPGTTLPANTTFIGPRAWRTNNATALAVGLDVVGWSIETDY
jgi:hypothetical protein